MDDRTRVVLADLGGGLAFLWLFARSQEWIPDEHRADLDPHSLLVGAISGFCVQYVSERDPIARKLVRYRYRLAHSLVVEVFQRILSRFVSSGESVSVGYLVGVVCYRFVFGVIRPVPEGRLRRASLLDWLRRSDRYSSK